MRESVWKFFLATMPPPEATAQIGALGDVIIPARGFRGHRVAPRHLHNTLAPFRKQLLTPRELVTRVKVVGSQFRARAFPVRYELTQSFRHNGDAHPFVLGGGDGLAPLRAFQGQLAQALYKGGIDVEFDTTPHITMIWANACVEEAPIPPLEWTVREFRLIASEQGQSRHVTLASWRLDRG